MGLSADLDILERRKYFLTFAGNEPWFLGHEICGLVSVTSVISYV
jgi:hypothetical protein